MALTFTQQELDYLNNQRLGRLATVDTNGVPQNNPVGFVIDEATNTIHIGGFNLSQTRKYRNVAATGHAALVVDDLVSVDPWTVRGVEIRGTADALTDIDPPMPAMSREAIRITPQWIGNWGLTEGERQLNVRRA